MKHASRRGSRILEIFSTKEKSEHKVASKVRWEERQRQRVVQEESARRSVQDGNDNGKLCWTEACEGIAMKIVKVSGGQRCHECQHKKTEGTSLVSNESRINIVHTARQARNSFSGKEKTRSSSLVRRGGMNN